METAREKIKMTLFKILSQYSTGLICKEKTQQLETCVKRMERGIFNHAIENAKKSNVARNWDDEKFRDFYRARYVAVRLNLQRAETKLAARVLRGEIAPEAVGEYMTVPEMYPELMESDKQMKEDIIKSSIIPSVLASTGASTILKCYRCLRSGDDAYKVTYHMQQTRRADEATTVFAHCTTCGARWRTY